MKRLLLWIAVPAAVLTALLYPTFFTQASAPPSDAEVIAAARAILSRLGYDPAAMSFSVHRSFDEEQYRRLRAAGSGKLAPLVSALEIDVAGKRGDGEVRLVLSERLTPVEWNASRVEPAKDVGAAEWLRVFGGSLAECFEEGSRKTKPRERQERRWTCREAETGNEARFTLTAQNRTVREAHMEVSPAPGTREIHLEWLQNTVSVFGILTMVVLGPAGFLYAATRRKRQRDHLKAAARFALLYLGSCLVLWTAGALPRMSGEEGAALFLGRPLALLITLAPGFALVTGWQAQSWLGMSVAVQKNLPARIVGREVLWGFALGQVVACVATLCALAALPWGALPGLIPLDRMFGRFQFTTALSSTPSEAIMILFLFGVLFPWVIREQASRARLWLAAGCGVALVTLGWHPVRGNGLSAVVASVGVFLVLAWGYRFVGMLAVLVAIPAATLAPAIALNAARRDTAGLASEIAPALVILGGSWIVARFGRTADLDGVRAELVRRNTPQLADIRPERERLLTEVSLAREAQQSLLPATPPALEGISVAAACIPAGEVGGDLYDYLTFPSNRTAFCVADVSGKGVTASVYNSYAKGMLAALARRDAPLETLAAELNGHFLESAQRKAFFTIVLALLDPATLSLQLLRMGHNPPLLLRACGETEWLRPPGLGVGLSSNKALMRVLRVQHLELHPGDTLVLYSDGLTEAMNQNQELYGEEGLREAVVRNAGLSAAELNGVLLSEVDAFRNGAEPNDDLTMLTVRVDGTTAGAGAAAKM